MKALFRGLALCLWLLTAAAVPVRAETEVTEDLLGNMDFGRVQSLLDGMLGKNSFSFGEAVKGLINGEEVFSEEAVQEILHGLFFSRMEAEKDRLFKVLLLVLAAAVFSNFTAVFENSQIGEASFYMVYLLLLRC